MQSAVRFDQLFKWKYITHSITFLPCEETWHLNVRYHKRRFPLKVIREEILQNNFNPMAGNNLSVSLFIITINILKFAHGTLGKFAFCYINWNFLHASYFHEVQLSMFVTTIYRSVKLCYIFHWAQTEFHKELHHQDYFFKKVS